MREIFDQAYQMGRLAKRKGYDCAAFDRDFMVLLAEVPEKGKKAVLAKWTAGHSEKIHTREEHIEQPKPNIERPSAEATAPVERTELDWETGF